MPSHTADDRPTFYFLGDSFIARLKDDVEAAVPGCQTHNLGVGGFGVDQIYLRAQSIQPHLKLAAGVLVGLFTKDLDRSVLRYRTGPKPFFLVERGELELQPLSPQEWGATAIELDLKSFSWALLTRQIRVLQGRGDRNNLPYGRKKKIQVNRALLEALVELFRESQVPHTFMLFYDPAALHTTSWRELFLVETLTELGAPFIDTKQLLIQLATQEQTRLSSFYAGDGHLNERGNARIVAALRRSYSSSLVCQSPPARGPKDSCHSM